MLRKTIIVISILMFALILGACNKGESKLSTNETIENKATTTVPKVKKDGDYKIKRLICTKGDDKFKYNIKYPQIIGLSDIDKQKRINDSLKDEAQKVLNYFREPLGSVDISVNYNVTLKNSNILSIKYSGMGWDNKAAHPYHIFFTTNINIETGDKIRLKDFVNIDKNFTDKFLNGEFKVVKSFQKEVLKNYSKYDISETPENFTEADSLDYIGTDKQSSVFSYFTKDFLGISVRTIYALGSHAEYEIKYKDISDNIKSKNEIWKNLLH